MSHQQIEHIFRHEYGQLVALLSRRLGIQHLDAVEDAVQWALTQALDSWQGNNIPDNPSAWLYQVAYRQLLSEFRSTKRRSELLNQYVSFGEDSDKNDTDEVAGISFTGELTDSLLRMLFIACHEELPVESQLVFTLKSLCGFNVREIALRLFISEANVYKRFSRAKQFLKKQSLQIETLTENEINTRLPLVHRILYLLFTEGYLSSHIDNAIRQDLCAESIRLTKLLVDSRLGDVPESAALLALMYFNLARIKSRQGDGGLVLLEQQDRTLWDHRLIAMGLVCLERSAQGQTISRYHVEANIAAEHCLSASFEKTAWHKIVASYQLLERIAPSPLHFLNRVIVTAEWQSADSALALLLSSDAPNWLLRTYHWYAVLADLQRRCGDFDNAKKNAEQAIQQAPTSKVKKMLARRLLS